MIDNLYYGGKPCACCAGSPRNDLSEAIFSADILEGFLRKIYDGFDVSREIEPSAWREVLRILNEGAVKGLTQGGERQHTPQFLQAIKHSNEVFSAFKCHSMGVKMAERLHDKDGNLRPFKEWRESVQPIASHHVGAWLKTEYDTAVLRAHQGSLWQEFERNKDILPNLRWMPTTSVSPENVHKGYWTSRLTLPVDDPFWQDNHPANRWNCKCSLEATRDKADTGHVAEMARQDNTAQQGLENNPRDGHLFSDKHPYFPDSCSSCPFKKQSKLKNWIGRLFNKGGQKKDCYDCLSVSLEIDKAKGYAPPEVETYKVKYGGKILISPYHGDLEYDENLRIGKRLSKLFNERVYLLPNLKPDNPQEKILRETLIPQGVKEGKNADFLIRGRTYEAKAMLKGDRDKTDEKYKNDIEKRYKEAIGQASHVVIEMRRIIPLHVIERAMGNKMKTATEGTTVILFYGKRTYIYTKEEKGYSKRGF